MTINLELPVMLPLTAEDYEQLEAPEGVRLELSEGTLEVAAAAQMHWHSHVIYRILSLLFHSGREASSETGVVLGHRTVRAPDVTRFRQGVVPDTDRSQFPAADVDLVVEVISPESGGRDRVIKPVEYARAGIPGFWLVERDPDNRTGAIVNMHELALEPTGPIYHLSRRVSLDALEAEVTG